MPKRYFFTANARFTLKPVDKAAAKAAREQFAKANGQAATESDVESIATLEGYPIVWNAVSDDRGGYKVRCLPNSAKFTAPTHAFWHHNPAQVLGNTANGTLRIMPDATGVKVQIDLPDTSDGNDANTLVSQQYVTGMSFAMVDAPDGSMSTENGVQILNVTSFTCDEVTVTAIPAFDQTDIAPAADFENVEDANENKNFENVEDDEENKGYAKSLAAEELRFEKARFDFLQLD